MSGHLYWRIRWALSRHPVVLNLFRCFPALRHTVVTRKTDLLIEGFPRSGNTFARNAFLLACNNKYELSSHLHFIGNVRRAIRLNKPVLILIRNPMDAVSSYLVYKGESLPARQALTEYIDFYTYVLNNRAHVVLASFEEVTQCFDIVLERVNERFATSFPIFDHTPENAQRCIDVIKGQKSPWIADKRQWSADKNSSFPTKGRSEHKQQAYDALLEPDLRGLIDQADELYKQLT